MFVGCSPGFFSVNRVCTECPSNSVRMAADDDEDFCTCSNDYRRSDPSQFEEDCLGRFHVHYDLGLCHTALNIICKV